MDVNESKQGGIVILQPVGAIDTRSAFDLEHKLDELLVAGSRSFVIDFSEVGLLASSGIRVLLMLVKRLTAVGGSLALCELTDYAKTVLDISGLTAQFSIAATREEALSMLQSLEMEAAAEPADDEVAPSPEGVGLSKVSSTMLKLLGHVGGALAARKPARQGKGRTSGLTQEVEQLVSVPGRGDAEADDS